LPSDVQERDVVAVVMEQRGAPRAAVEHVEHGPLQCVPKTSGHRFDSSLRVTIRKVDASRKRSPTPILGVLISGRGSNLKAIIDAIAGGRLDATIAVVISNRADAPGLEHARRAGIETLVLSHRAFATREDFDRAMVNELKARGVALVCLAGFMRLLSAEFVTAFAGRILNIHPSLLPKYPGLHPQQQALDDGATVSGATVHVVNAELDAGPVVLQREVPVLPGDTAESLAARILEVEHHLYPDAIRLVLDRLARPRPA
jgi:phosphoribosylglycinamide formyltransferase-1